MTGCGRTRPDSEGHQIFRYLPVGNCGCRPGTDFRQSESEPGTTLTPFTRTDVCCAPFASSQSKTRWANNGHCLTCLFTKTGQPKPFNVSLAIAFPHVHVGDTLNPFHGDFWN